MRKITIDPITRLEGHGKIEIFLNDDGEVANVYFQIPELRGFEKFCEGRPVEEMPRITPRICGVCPEAHHMAVDQGPRRGLRRRAARPPGEAARAALQRLLSPATTRPLLSSWAGPTSSSGPTRRPAERNILGVIAKVGLEIGGKVIKHARATASEISRDHRRQGHPPRLRAAGRRRARRSPQEERERASRRSATRPGRVRQVRAQGLRRRRAEEQGLRRPDHERRLHPRDLLHGPGRREQQGQLLRRQGPRGRPRRQGVRQVRRRRTTSTTSPSTSSPGRYLKFPYLKKVGWKGFVDGQDSGVYRAAPLGAPQRRRRHGDAAGAGGVRADVRDARRQAGARHAGHALGAADRAALRRRADAGAGAGSRDHRSRRAHDPDRDADEGVGMSRRRAARSTITTRPTRRGIVTKVNLIVGTTNNNAADLACRSRRRRRA